MDRKTCIQEKSAPSADVKKLFLLFVSLASYYFYFALPVQHVSIASAVTCHAKNISNEVSV